MSYKNEDPKEKGKYLINEYNNMKNTLSRLMNKSKYDKYTMTICHIYLINLDWINKWKKSLSANQNNKIEEIKLINNLEQLKNAIFSNETFDIILDDYIKIFTNIYNRINFNQSFESYFGNKKIIIKFEKNSILLIVKNKEKNSIKYFITNLPLNYSESTKLSSIKKIISINVDIFFKKSNFNREGLEFTELNSLKNESQNNPSENLNKKNELTIQYLKVNTNNPNNLKNNNKNDINQIINNKLINESNKESLPNNSTQIIQNNQESQIILNNPKI